MESWKYVCIFVVILCCEIIVCTQLPDTCNHQDGFITTFDKETTTEKSETIKFTFCKNNVLQTKTIKIKKKNCFQDGIQHPGFPVYCVGRKVRSEHEVLILFKSCVESDTGKHDLNRIKTSCSLLTFLPTQ